MTLKNRKKTLRNFMFFWLKASPVAQTPFMEAKGLSKLEFFIKKILNIFSAVNFLSIFGHQNPGSRSCSGLVFSLKCWVRNRIRIRTLIYHPGCLSRILIFFHPVSRITDQQEQKCGFAIRQCCASWLFISDPNFYSSWILDPGFRIHLTFLVATNVTKL